LAELTQSVVFLRLIIRIGRHEQRLARPVGIRILAIHFVELLRRTLVFLLVVEQEKPLVVELVGGIVGDAVVVLVEYAAADQRRGEERQRNKSGQRTQPATGSSRSS
jgi:hypothetical protein